MITRCLNFLYISRDFLSLLICRPVVIFINLVWYLCELC